MKRGMKSSGKRCSGWRRVGSAVILTGLFCVLGSAAAFAAGVSLDENEEIQWLMGDLSALKTAAHAYYSENGQSRKAPSLSEILRYFDEDSLPPDAASLYAIRSGVAGWYVGYRAAGLKDETCGLLSENANTLELVCDDLRSPWRLGSAYIWSLALPLGVSGAPSATIRGGDAAGTAAVMIGTAILLNIIDDHRHGGYTYHYPKGPWYWRSPLVYRRPYRDRLFGRLGRAHRSAPLPPRRLPAIRPGGPRPGREKAPAPRLRGPAGREHGVRRPERRPESLRGGRRLKGPRPEERSRPETVRRRGEELRREDGKGGSKPGP
jgi:hypothetical protein